MQSFQLTRLSCARGKCQNADVLMFSITIGSSWSFPCTPLTLLTFLSSTVNNSHTSLAAKFLREQLFPFAACISGADKVRDDCCVDEMVVAKSA